MISAPRLGFINHRASSQCIDDANSHFLKTSTSHPTCQGRGGRSTVALYSFPDLAQKDEYFGLYIISDRSYVPIMFCMSCDILIDPHLEIAYTRTKFQI